MKTKIYKIIRIITIPPIIVSILLITLIINKTITSILDGVLLILFLGIMPILSYPINKLFKGNRESERKLSFVFTITSYFLGFLYAIIFVENKSVKFIYYVYFLSVVMLTIFNLFITRASGHIASVTGLLFISFHNISALTLIYTFPIFILTYISSIKIKRHNNIELLLGIVTICISYIITRLIL